MLNAEFSSFVKGCGEGRGTIGGRQENSSDRSVVKGRGSEGRGSGNKSEKRHSKTKKNGSSSSGGGGGGAESNGKGRTEAKSDDGAGSSSLANAAAASVTLPTMPIAPEAKKGMPSKINSYAALIDDSDED